MLTLAHYTAIQEMFESGDGFAFARFNDGEMRGIKAIGDTVARGDQYVYPSLHSALVKSLQHEQKNYWKGFPCKTCYPDLRQLYHTYVGEDKPYQTYAVTLCNNGHWKKFIEQFGRLVGNRKLVWIAGEDQSIHGLHSILDVNKIDLQIQLPVRNAWSVYDKITGYGSEFKPDSVVVMSCGPLATVLACELFKVRQDCVFFDAGSLFDPYTRNVWHGCHTGKLKYCPECNHEL
jgi:RNase P subunit RPR2